MPKRLNLVGQRFGLLLAIKKAPTSQKYYNRTRLLCLCDCGGMTIIYASNLKRSHTQSCGCKNRASKNKTHGFSRSRSPEYDAWKNMRGRCNNPNGEDWKNYGGRGIKVAKVYDSFERFLKDIGPRPGPQYTVERINNNGNYAPGNIRWATRKEQAVNKRPFTLSEEGKAKNRAAALKMWNNRTPKQKVTHIKKMALARRAAAKARREVKMSTREFECRDSLWLAI